MKVVNEEMREKIADAFRKLAGFTPVGVDAAVQIGRGQAVTKRDETPVEIALQFGKPLRLIDFGIAVENRAAPARLLQGIEIVEVDLKDVVESGFDRRKEADARGRELAWLQSQDGSVDPIIRPAIVCRHAAEMFDQFHRSDYGGGEAAYRLRLC